MRRADRLSGPRRRSTGRPASAVTDCAARGDLQRRCAHEVTVGIENRA